MLVEEVDSIEREKRSLPPACTAIACMQPPIEEVEEDAMNIKEEYECI